MLPSKGSNETTHESENFTQENAATPKNPCLGFYRATAPALGSNRSSLFRAPHEAIIHSFWDSSIRALLLQRFPNATAA